MNKRSGRSNAYTVTMGADCDYFGEEIKTEMAHMVEELLHNEEKRLELATLRLSDAYYRDKQASIGARYLRTVVLGRNGREYAMRGHRREDIYRGFN